MKALVINLTRMGDLIQTIGLINKIHEYIPDVKIDVLVMKSFSPIVKHFNHINEIITIDEEIFGENISDDIWGSYTELHKLINNLNQKNYDLLFNPIISKQSALFSYLINAHQKYGLQLTENREQKMTCDFISYLLANQHSLGDFSFNLVDIFAGMMKAPSVGNAFIRSASGNMPSSHIQSLVPEAERINAFPTDGRTNKCVPDGFSALVTDFSLNIFPETLHSISDFTTKIKSPNKPIIGFHIGASQSNKAWDIIYYHRVIEILLQKKEYVLVLFGGYKEKEYKSHFTDFTSDLFFNTIGDFPLPELIAAISMIDLFVTNDTGPMHIASALHKPVIDISLGPVSKWETGAYNLDALIIEARLDCHPCSFTTECSHWSCHHFITPEIVVDAIEFKINEGYVKGPTIDAETFCHSEQREESPRCFVPQHDNRGAEVKLLKRQIVTLQPHLNVRFYTTIIDDFGFLSFTHYFKEEITEKEYIFLLKRFIWSLYFTDQLNLDEDKQKALFEKAKSAYLIPSFDFDNLNNHISELIHIIQAILNDLNIVNNEQNKQHLLLVKKNKEILFSKAGEFDLIYDWFWFFLFKESEIEDYELGIIVRKTIVLYEILLKKLCVLGRFLPSVGNAFIRSASGK